MFHKITIVQMQSEYQVKELHGTVSIIWLHHISSSRTKAKKKKKKPSIFLRCFLPNQTMRSLLFPLYREKTDLVWQQLG